MANSEAFRQLLDLCFKERARLLKKYPLRAFAQELQIDVSSLHDILKGERKVGPKLIRRLGKRIGLSDEQLAKLLSENE